jgi:predicted nicotinamide N-methyase
MAMGSSAADTEDPAPTAQAERTRLAGNKRFKARDYEGAAALYSQALALLVPEHEQRAARGVVLANRAAARLAAGWYTECLDDCSLATACDVSSELAAKLTTRHAKASAKLADASRVCEDARAALAAGSFGPAMELLTKALVAVGPGPAADASRASLLCDRSDARAAVGDWVGALDDAGHSVRTASTARGETALARLTTFVQSRNADTAAAGRGGGRPAEVVETGLAPGSSTLTSVRVTADCSVALREVYLCTTGGRLWHAALLLAHHLLSERSSGRKVLEKLQGAPLSSSCRVLEVGAGLGLVGLALASALQAHASASVTLTDCDRETNDNLRQEVLLNSHCLVEPGAAPGAAATPPRVGASGSGCGNGCAMSVCELDYGPQDVESSCAALIAATGSTTEAETAAGAETEAAAGGPFDLIVGSDTIFSETHKSLGIALSRLIAKPSGQAVLCLADKRVGIGGFLAVCEAEGLAVEVKPIDETMRHVAAEETEDDDLGTERPHSLYYISWRDE